MSLGIACGVSSGDVKADSNLEQSMNGVELRTRVEQSDERVRVAIQLTNRRAEPVYVLDVALRVTEGGSSVRRDHLVPSTLPPAIAVLSSKLAPLDPTASWTVPPTAWASRVEPGATHESDLEAPLPLLVDGELPRGLRCDRLRFELGVIPHAPELRARPVTVAGVPLYELSAAAFSLQEVLVVEHARVSLPVRRADP